MPGLRSPSPLEPHTPNSPAVWPDPHVGPVGPPRLWVPHSRTVSAHCMPGPPRDPAHASTGCQACPMAALRRTAVNTALAVSSRLKALRLQTATPSSSPPSARAAAAALCPQAGRWPLSESRTASVTHRMASPNQQRQVLPAGDILHSCRGRVRGSLTSHDRNSSSLSLGVGETAASCSACCRPPCVPLPP